MAKAYDHHHLTYQTYYTNNSFLPLLCPSSVADVKLRDFKDQSSCFSDDPSSPKVSCIGQIKRNNKIFIPFSTTTTTRRSSLPPSSTTGTATAAATQTGTKTNGTQIITYTKLKKWFSLKNISPATTTDESMVYGSRAAGGGSCRNGSRETGRWSSKINSDDDGGRNHVRVNISELDPPLPVTKKLSVVPSEMSLWSRRSGGEALTSLTVQHQIHLPNEPAATV